jgi:wobble nucleotide-excising tRNase
MLEKIVAIKNVGRFKSCASVGDVTFRKFSFISAENGRGKTTLCAILRSLATNVPALIVGRKTLGVQSDPEVDLRIDGAMVTFRRDQWRGAIPRLAIFDSTYVSENVFAGEFVDTEHRRNLYRVIIGAQGVADAARITDLDNQIRNKNSEIRNNRDRIGRYVPVSMTIDAYLALQEDPQIAAKITSKEQELQAVQRAAQLLRRNALTSIPVPSFPASFAALLAKTLDGVANDVETKVKEHLAKHRMQEGGERWVNEGLRFGDQDCPFCGQDVQEIPLITAYKHYFSDEYNTLRGRVAALDGQVTDAVGDRVSTAIENTLLQNTSAVEFWAQYTEIIAPELADRGRLRQTLLGLQTSAQDLLRRKAANPLETVPPDEIFTEALTAFEGVRTAIANYNNAVATANGLINARKRLVEASNVTDVQASLDMLKAQQSRHTADIRGLCATDVRLQTEKTALEQAKAEARTRLDTHTAQLIARYGQSINVYLEQINAGFRISTPTHTYRGGTPSTSYQILINQVGVDLGDSTTPLNVPSFRNTLSAGDKNTLALAFFLSQLSQDANQTQKIVVFDDPFSSLDDFRRTHTAYQIFRCGQRCTQVIVLSHEQMFLRVICGMVDAAQCKTLRLTRIGEDNTQIIQWDINIATQSQYSDDVAALRRYLGGDGNARDVIRKLRPVLEVHCKKISPGSFLDTDSFGEIIGKIRSAGNTHPLFGIMDNLDEINVYSRQHHHGEDASIHIDEEELAGYVKKTLKLAGQLP